jgi:hypothetical protein
MTDLRKKPNATIPPSTAEYDVRVVKIVVAPNGEPIYSETATVVEIEDDATGEYVKVSQPVSHTGLAKSVAFNPDEWPTMRGAIEYMLANCRDK